jgi:hypothetical protein
VPGLLHPYPAVELPLRTKRECPLRTLRFFKTTWNVQDAGRCSPQLSR